MRFEQQRIGVTIRFSEKYSALLYELNRYVYTLLFAFDKIVHLHRTSSYGSRYIVYAVLCVFQLKMQ